jgi:hypothetical protein
MYRSEGTSSCSTEYAPALQEGNSFAVWRRSDILEGQVGRQDEAYGGMYPAKCSGVDDQAPVTARAPKRRAPKGQAALCASLAVKS